MNENREDPAATIMQTIDQLAALVSPELINALSKAADQDELWLEAVRDARGFLRERDVGLPDWAEIKLEAVFPPTAVRSNQDDSGGNPGAPWMRELPHCEPGELKVGREGGRYCACSVKLCSWAPHLGTVCIEFCLRHEDWIDWRCVRAEDLITHQVSIRP